MQDEPAEQQPTNQTPSVSQNTPDISSGQTPPVSEFTPQSQQPPQTTAYQTQTQPVEQPQPQNIPQTAPVLPEVPQPIPQSTQPTTTKSIVKRQISVKKVRQVIFYILSVLELLFGLRFVFKLLTANSPSPLVQWIYDVSDIFLDPFVGIVKNSGNVNHVLEWTTLIGMALYAVLALILIGLAKLFAPTAPTKVWEE